ncbi:MAG: LL-diaminopimelate aminotransferase [Candidatus Melainabacteria bacterium RIFOXYA12_FULL_32_12]|nr:MAG: LL-diaminopimelate aminotransferase [Candidatus Melainabacteria bacterium RIFOXYA2_FULL_32_9]OGI29348.1 MAG: LL-diaminopimelate aminotransferase [Candidatus Melainabacteria bacterium RIFOXYA12_FULL_32_12]
MYTKLNIVPSKKLLNLPTYIFAELDEWKEEARSKGADLIDLGIGNPDGATPAPIVEAAVKSIQDPKNHGYPSFKGKDELRQEIAKWVKRKYNVDVNPETEVQTLLGAKEGLAHLALAMTDPGDINIVPDPYYPVHSRGTWISNGDVYHVKLEAKNDFLPDLSTIPEDVAKRAKIFFISYPNNPTSGIATKEFYKDLVKFCTKYNILLCSDLAYAELCFDGHRPLSIFEIEGAKDVAIEFHSFSKTFNMAGWRIGFAIGNKDFIKILYSIKTNIDYGTSSIVQDAAIAALKMPESYVNGIVAKYQNRRDFMTEGFNKLGWNLSNPKATMYMWLPVPGNQDSKSWCKMVLEKTGVVFTPGIAFGKYSDNYFRVSLVAPDERLKEALCRLESANIRYC